VLDVRIELVVQVTRPGSLQLAPLALGNPWASLNPVIVDMSASNRALGYRAISTYADAVGTSCAWIVDELSRRDWSGTYLRDYFDYVAEDPRLLRALA
jgi:hypothetical protein